MLHYQRNTLLNHPMNKAQLVNEIAAKSGLHKACAKRALEATMKVIKAELEEGRRVRVNGFGSFIVSKRLQRLGVNPRTGQRIFIPARKVVRFKTAKALTEDIN